MSTNKDKAPEMTHEEILAARLKLRLSVKDFAKVLETAPLTIRRMQQDPATTKNARQPAPRMVRLIKLYLAGVRTPDWPSENRWIDPVEPKQSTQACSFSSVRTTSREVTE